MFVTVGSRAGRGKKLTRGNGYLATSTTSLATAGSGSKAFTTQAGLAYTVGARIRATSAGTGEWMEGVVTAYSGTTLTVTMDLNSGTGTHADWNINLAGERGAAGAGASWQLVDTSGAPTSGHSWTWSTNVAEVDFTGLGSFNEALLIARGVSASASGVRVLRVSVNGGSTYFSSSGDYINVNANGVESAGGGFSHSTNTTSAVSLVVHIVNLKGPHKLADVTNSTANRMLFVASTSDINALQFINSTGGNLTAGTIDLFVR